MTVVSRTLPACLLAVAVCWTGVTAGGGESAFRAIQSQLLRQRAKGKGKGKIAEKEKAAPETQTVEAEGRGATVEEARQEAIRAAVLKVAGVLVVGETTVENDKVIKDKVLTYSDGVIAQDSYKELRKKKDGGVWHVTISATVINRRLAERLTAVGYDVRPIDGENLAVAVLSRAEARKKAGAILKDALADLRFCVVATAARPTVKDYIEDDQRLVVNVSVAADLKRYLVLLKRLDEVLKVVAVNQGQRAFVEEMPKGRKGITPPPKGGGVKRINNGPGKAKGKGRFSDDDTKVEAAFQAAPRSNDFLSLQVEEDDKRTWFLWLLNSSSATWKSTRWGTYQLDCKREEVLEALSGRATLLIKLLDSDGEVVKKHEVELQPDPKSRFAFSANEGWLWQVSEPRGRSVGRAKGMPGPNVALGPMYFAAHSGLRFALSQEVRCKVAISPADLRRVKDIRCEVRFR